MVFYVARLAQAWATCAYSMGTYAFGRVMRVFVRARVTRGVAKSQSESTFYQNIDRI